jgi:O-antigen/teichoic acid export membrane protein
MENLNKHDIERSKVRENTVALLTASVLSKGFFIILMLYFTRYMGAAIYGEYLSVMALILVFRMFVNFGLSRLLVRDIARDFSRIEDYLGNSIVISVGLSFFFYIVLLITGNLLRYPAEIIALISIAGLSLLPFSIALIFESVLHAIQHMTKSSAWGVANSFLAVVSSIVILHLGYGLKGIFIALFFVNVIYAYGLYLSLLRVNICIKLKYDTAFIFNILKTVLPFASFIAMRMIYYSVGIIMLSKLETSEAVGWYGAPFRFMETLLIIPGSLALALFPVMSKHYEQSLESLWQSYGNALRYLIILGLPLCITIAILSKTIVPLLFGNNFLPSIPVMSILALSTMITFVKSPSAIVILNSNYFSRFVLFYIIYLLFSTGVNYLLISQYSYIGASFAILTTEFIMFMIHMYFLILIFNKIPNLLKLSFRPLLAALIIGIGIVIFNSFPLILLLIFAFLIYFTILFISGDFSKEEILKIKDMYLNAKNLFGNLSS